MQTPEEYEVSQRIGRLIQGLKRKKGWTREEVSRRMGVGNRTLDNYLNGSSSFKLGTLLRFAEICKVKLSDILEDTDKLSSLYGEKNEEKNNEAVQKKPKKIVLDRSLCKQVYGSGSSKGGERKIKSQKHKHRVLVVRIIIYEKSI